MGRAKKVGIALLIAFNILVIATAVSSTDPLSIIIAFAVLESIIVLPAYAISRYVKRRKAARQIEDTAKKVEPETSHSNFMDRSDEKIKESILAGEQGVKSVEATKRVTCPQCGTEFDGQAQFCSICGERFSIK